MPAFLDVFFSGHFYLTLIGSRLTQIKLVVCLIIYNSFLLLVTYIELDVASRQLSLFMFLSLSVSVRSGVEFNLASQYIVTNSGIKGPVCFIGCTWSRGYHWRRDHAPVLALYALVKSAPSGPRFRLRSSRLEGFTVFGQADSHDEFRLKYLLKLIFNLAFRLYAVQVFLKHTLIVSETV